MNASLALDTLTIGQIIDGDDELRTIACEMAAGILKQRGHLGTPVEATVDALVPADATPPYRNGNKVRYTSKGGRERGYTVTSCFRSTKEHNRGEWVVGLKGFGYKFYVEAKLVRSR